MNSNCTNTTAQSIFLYNSSSLCSAVGVLRARSLSLHLESIIQFPGLYYSQQLSTDQHTAQLKRPRRAAQSPQQNVGILRPCEPRMLITSTFWQQSLLEQNSLLKTIFFLRCVNATVHFWLGLGTNTLWMSGWRILLVSLKLFGRQSPGCFVLQAAGHMNMFRPLHLDLHRVQ